MLLKESDDTIVMPANCNDNKISSNLNGESNLLNENHESDILHNQLCSMPKSLNSSEISPSTPPSVPTVNISPDDNNVPDRQRKYGTCHKDDTYKIEPRPASHE